MKNDVEQLKTKLAEQGWDVEEPKRAEHTDGYYTRLTKTVDRGDTTETSVKLGWGDTPENSIRAAYVQALATSGNQTDGQ